MTPWSRVSLDYPASLHPSPGPVQNIGRSLWLDEAWVANSIHAPSLREMFYYPDWLQTNPPSFLLLSLRAAINLVRTFQRIVPISPPGVRG